MKRMQQWARPSRSPIFPEPLSLLGIKIYPGICGGQHGWGRLELSRRPRASDKVNYSIIRNVNALNRDIFPQSKWISELYFRLKRRSKHAIKDPHLEYPSLFYHWIWLLPAREDATFLKIRSQHETKFAVSWAGKPGDWAAGGHGGFGSA